VGRDRQKYKISTKTYDLVDEKRALKAHKQDSKTAAKHYNFLCRKNRKMQKEQDRKDYLNMQWVSGSRNGTDAEEEQERDSSHQEESAYKHSCQSNIVKDKQKCAHRSIRGQGMLRETFSE